MSVRRWLGKLDDDARQGRLRSRTVVVAPLLVLGLPAVGAGLGFLSALFLGLLVSSPAATGQVQDYNIAGPFYGALFGTAVGLLAALALLLRRRG